MSAPLKLRHARLDDAGQICDINRSHIERWYRKIDAEQYEVPYDSLSISERWGFGGPWMSIETCAIHLNNLLLKHQLPIVAQIGEELVGVMELFLGKEAAPLGNNMHIGLLYVKKGHTGKGVGRALVEKAFNLAAEHGCDTVTVASSQANETFYEKCGFERSRAMIEIEVIPKESDVAIKPLRAPLNVQSFARGKSMVIGRYQSSSYHLFELQDACATPDFLSARRETVFAEVSGYPSLFAFVKYGVQPQTAEVYAWTEGTDTGDVISAALTLLHRDHVGYATLLLAMEDYTIIADTVDAAVKGPRTSLVRRV
jgi:ribosomal protein S18 acetylase RimI-like enzyme